MHRDQILEVGCFCLFARVWPSCTTFRFAGPNRYPIAGALPRRFGWRDWRISPECAAVVAYTAPEPTWRTLRRITSWPQARDAMAALKWVLAQRFRLGGGSVPLAVLDMHDTNTIRSHDLPLLRAATLYFKRELALDPTAVFAPNLDAAEANRLRGRLRPISLGLSAERVADAPCVLPDKTVDLFFAGSTDHAPAIRQAGLSQLRALRASGVRVDIADAPIPRREFLARCARAYLVWSPEGLGWDCFRHYEAALCGAVPVMNAPTIVRHAPLEPGRHALHYDVRGNDLQRVIRCALRNRAQLVSMGRSSREHVLKHHTHQAICEYVIRECRAEMERRGDGVALTGLPL